MSKHALLRWARAGGALGEQRVLHQLAQQQPVRAELNPRFDWVSLVVEPDAVPDALPELHAELVCNALRDGNGSHTSRLRHNAHAPPAAPASLLHVHAHNVTKIQ